MEQFTERETATRDLLGTLLRIEDASVARAKCFELSKPQLEALSGIITQLNKEEFIKERQEEFASRGAKLLEDNEFRPQKLMSKVEGKMFNLTSFVYQALKAKN